MQYGTRHENMICVYLNSDIYFEDVHSLSFVLTSITLITWTK